MSEVASMTTTHQMYRALSALRLEVPASIADDVAEKVIAVVDAANARAARLEAVLRTVHGLLDGKPCPLPGPHTSCPYEAAWAAIDAALGGGE